MAAASSLPLQVRSMGVSLGWSRWLAVVALGLLGSVAVVVVARRAAGAFEQSLEPAVLVAIGLLVAFVAVAIRLAWFQWSDRAPPLPWDWAVTTATSASVAALAGAICLAETATSGVFLLVTVLAAEESAAWAWHLRRHFGAASPATPRNATTPPRRSSEHSPLVASDPTESGDLIQQFTRTQTADGAEQLAGCVRVPFLAGQRTGSVHIAFCPAFATVPEFEFEQSDGPEARIKTGQLLPYGVRLDLKLTAAAEEPTSVLLQFSARTTAE